MGNFNLVLREGQFVSDRILKTFARETGQIVKEFKEHTRFRKNKKRKKTQRTPPPDLRSRHSALGLMLLREARLRYGVHPDPRSFEQDDESKRIRGSIVIAENITTGEFLVTLDKNRQIYDGTTIEQTRDTILIERWGFLGGKREEDETSLANALREFLEEAGIDLLLVDAPIQRVGSIQLRTRGFYIPPHKRPRVAVYHAYLTDSIAKTVRPGDEQWEVKWFDPSTIEFLIEEMRDLHSTQRFLENQANAWSVYRTRRQNGNGTA